MKTRFRRIIAAFLLVNILQSVLLPTVASALTSGPTTPETSSFEPVDTTDMVNLATGDFTYNIPILEVPGPEGGYPLSLSYHAGIKPLEDASWVGLGWTLNPGTINRAVNGYPDDQRNITRTVEDYWSGGQTQSYSVGISFGLPSEVASVGLDITISNDTYRGLGGDVGLSMNVGYGFDDNVNLGVGGGVSVGSSGARFSGSVGLSTKAGLNLGMGGSVDLQGNAAGGLSAGFSQAGTSIASVGINLSSSGLKPSLTVTSNQMLTSNNNFGKISTSGYGFTIPVPIAPGTWLNLGYDYRRYWMQEKDNVIIDGVLHAYNYPSTNYAGVIPPDNSFDSYSLLDKELDPVVNNNPDAVSAGSFPSYDSYQVSAQGISGTIQPYLFQNGSLYRKGRTGDLSFRKANSFTMSPKFRFKNDFSNALTLNQHPSITWQFDANQPPAVSGAQDLLFNANPDETQSGFSSGQHLAGSKHVKYFTNTQIDDKTSIASAMLNGFMDYHLPLTRGTKYSYDVSNQVGGFSVTNESGVTYHYAIPVYSYNEYIENKLLDQSNGSSWNMQTNNQPYAYTWLLTAITGPDFVDRGGGDGTSANGIVDDKDWGYWVVFDYGMWASNYQWRTPPIDGNIDISGKSKYFSYGKKEIYYLDAIKTRSHTALFVKDVRQDGKGVTDKSAGGFGQYEGRVCFDGPGNSYYVQGVKKPTSVMSLSKILLLKNEDLPSGTTLSTIKSAGSFGNIDQRIFTHPFCGNTLTVDYHYSDNVLDVTDIGSYPSLTSNAFKTVVLGTDYSLCPETVNSYDNALYTNTTNGSTQGKLTLNKITFLGKGGSVSLPSLNFFYDYVGSDYEANQSYSYTITQSLGNSKYKIKINSTDANLENGDLIKHIGSSPWYGMLTNKTSCTPSCTYFDIINLGAQAPTLNQAGNVKETKNPPFHSTKFDYWGDYKPDFNTTAGYSQTNMARRPNTLSARSADVWSLRTIETSLGAKIKPSFSKKHYNSVASMQTDRVHIASATYNSGTNKTTFTFSDGFDCTEIFAVNYSVSGHVVTTQTVPSGSTSFVNNTLVTAVTPTSIDVVGNYGQCLGGYLNIPYISSNPMMRYGDGLITNSISILGSNETHATEYNYVNGRISYTPSSLEPPSGSPSLQTYQSAYKLPMSHIIALARELPSPDYIVYEYTQVKEKRNSIAFPGEKRYYFYRPQANSVTVQYSSYNYTTPPSGYWATEVSSREAVVKDKSSKIGTLLKSEIYNGQGQIVSKVVYNYADDESSETEADYDTYYKQGIVHQAFNEIKVKDGNKLKGVVSVRKEYPSVLKSTTTTELGVATTITNKKFDFYSGQPSEVLTSKANGQYFLSKMVPARKIWSDMGLKINDNYAVSKKNMLTQIAELYTYKSDANGTADNSNLLSASITTWEDDWNYREFNSTSNKYEVIAGTNKIWRKHKEFSWRSDSNPDGTYTSFTPFNYSFPPSGWQKVSETTLYDHYSKPLEETDINGNYATAKMGYGESLVLGAASNAKYTEMYYTGCEDLGTNGWFGGEVTPSNGVVESSFAHTGSKCLKVTAGTTNHGFITKMKVGTDIVAGRTYEASVWVKDDGSLSTKNIYSEFQNTGGTLVAGTATSTPASTNEMKAGGWVLVKHKVTVPSSGYTGYTLLIRVQNTGTTGTHSYYDDFRIRPIDAPMTSYVYDPQTGQVTYILDNDHLFTQYQYDEAGRLIAVYRETPENPTGKRKISETKYKYKRPLN